MGGGGKNTHSYGTDRVCGTIMHICVFNTDYNAVSRDGRSLTDQEIVGMLIGLLMAGQHTSSTTSAWLGFYLAKDKHMQVSICNLRCVK